MGLKREKAADSTCREGMKSQSGGWVLFIGYKLQREMEGHNIYGTSTGAEAIRERKTGWLEAGGEKGGLLEAG